MFLVPTRRLCSNLEILQAYQCDVSDAGQVDRIVGEIFNDKKMGPVVGLIAVRTYIQVH
jgi:hypothetical protein